MYLVNFINGNEQLSILSNTILNDGNNLMIKCQEDTQASLLLDFKDVEIFVKSDDNEPSEVLCSKISHIDVNADVIKIFLDTDEYDEIFDRHIFKHINKMMAQTKRAWTGYGDDEKFEWLRACFYYHRKHSHYHKNIAISGKDVQSKNTFLCDFAENLIGVGGYFGADLDAFDDCFGIYDIKEVTLVWYDFDDSNFQEKSIILDILSDRKVNIVKK